MSDVDRELRDRLEQAQSDLKRANARLDELETVAADREVLRAQLDSARAQLKAANDRLTELETQSTETLQEELAALTEERNLLKQRLEQADKTREQWDQKVAQRENDLALATAEVWRLKEELANRPVPELPKVRGIHFLVPAAGLLIAAAAALLLRACV